MRSAWNPQTISTQHLIETWLSEEHHLVESSSWRGIFITHCRIVCDIRTFAPLHGLSSKQPGVHAPRQACHQRHLSWHHPRLSVKYKVLQNFVTHFRCQISWCKCAVFQEGRAPVIFARRLSKLHEMCTSINSSALRAVKTQITSVCRNQRNMSPCSCKEPTRWFLLEYPVKGPQQLHRGGKNSTSGEVDNWCCVRSPHGTKAQFTLRCEYSLSCQSSMLHDLEMPPSPDPNTAAARCSLGWHYRLNPFSLIWGQQ